MPLCDDDTMEQLVAALQSNDAGELQLVDDQLRKFPEDPRLHFMRGSLLAARKQPVAAHQALSRAVELAPDYHIARYQLGFFELTPASRTTLPAHLYRGHDPSRARRIRTGHRPVPGRYAAK